MDSGTIVHPPEELLEVLLLASEELSPELLRAVAGHVHECRLCRKVRDLLLHYHNVVEAAGRSPHVDAMVRVAFVGDELPISAGRGQKIVA
jgi:hypothetical protein